MQGLTAFRVQSPVFALTFPQNALFGLPAGGPFSPNVSDGYWLMLKPLPPGAHTLSFKGVQAAGFAAEVTYNLTVR